MKKYLSLFVILFFLFNVFPNRFCLIDKSIASDSSSDEFEGEEDDGKIYLEVKKKNIRPDPPFFKLELLDGEKNIYIIGSMCILYHQK